MDLMWDESLNTGIMCFDEEHRSILKMLNVIRGMISSGDKKEACLFTTKVVIPYLIEHLRHEEEVMKVAGYPEADIHAKSHESIERLFMESLRAIDERGHGEMRFFHALTVSWLFGHIKKTDAKYGKYFAEKGLLEKLNQIEPLKPDTDLLRDLYLSPPLRR